MDMDALRTALMTHLTQSYRALKRQYQGDTDRQQALDDALALLAHAPSMPMGEYMAELRRLKTILKPADPSSPAYESYRQFWHECALLYQFVLLQNLSAKPGEGMPFTHALSATPASRHLYPSRPYHPRFLHDIHRRITTEWHLGDVEVIEATNEPSERPAYSKWEVTVQGNRSPIILLLPDSLYMGHFQEKDMDGGEGSEPSSSDKISHDA
jgi:hypothetical protein